MSFNSPNMNWTVPTVGADRNVWGRFLNAIFSTDTITSLDACLYALFNTNAGPTAPTYPTIGRGRGWLDTSDSALYKFKMYDGTAWVEIGEIDPNDHTFAIPGSSFVVGQITQWAGFGTAPVRWLKCNGADVSRATYVALFNAITFTATGDTAIGSAVIQNMSSLDGIYVGMNLEVNGLAYPATVLSIDDTDPSNLKITCNSNIAVTAAGVTIRFLPYGAAASNTDFKVPDFRGRMPVGVDNFAFEMGQGGGSDTSNGVGPHSHAITTDVLAAWQPFESNINGAFAPGTIVGPDPVRVTTKKYINLGLTIDNQLAIKNAFTDVEGDEFDIMNPYQVVNYLIYAGV